MSEDYNPSGLATSTVLRLGPETGRTISGVSDPHQRLYSAKRGMGYAWAKPRSRVCGVGPMERRGWRVASLVDLRAPEGLKLLGPCRQRRVVVTGLVLMVRRKRGSKRG